jgi:hypothetical protein
LTQSLPNTRPALLALHAEVRRRRDRAALGGAEYRQACQEIAAIEVQIARIEQPPEPPPKDPPTQDPPTQDPPPQDPPPEDPPTASVGPAAPSAGEPVGPAAPSVGG